MKVSILMLNSGDGGDRGGRLAVTGMIENAWTRVISSSLEGVSEQA